MSGLLDSAKVCRELRTESCMCTESCCRCEYILDDTSQRSFDLSLHAFIEDLAGLSREQRHETGQDRTACFLVFCSDAAACSLSLCVSSLSIWGGCSLRHKFKYAITKICQPDELYRACIFIVAMATTHVWLDSYKFRQVLPTRGRL
jgi:hypothetical protein